MKATIRCLTIAARAKAEGATIFWGDETAVTEDGHWLRGYVPAGQTPVFGRTEQAPWTVDGLCHQQPRTGTLRVH